MALPVLPERAIETDALIIGAGPVGLFQVFQLGLLEISAHVVDALPHVGGQCAELYADKPIYDIPGVPHCTGRELVARLQEQIKPFQAPLHLGQLVTELARLPDARFQVRTSAGTQFIARTVFIAAGAGAFQPRRINLDGLAAYEGTQLFYAGFNAPLADELYAGQRILILGDDEGALARAVALANLAPGQRPVAICLAHRRDVFQAEPGTLAAFQALRGTGQIQFVAGQVNGFSTANAPGSESENQPPQERLKSIQLLGSDAQLHTLEVDLVVAHLGLSPKLGPLAQWGLALERKQVPVDTARFETAVPSLYAVGDINTYPGKRKLILSGFHEATLAAYAAAERVFPDKRVHLQYTTTSPRLHALLKQTS